MHTYLAFKLICRIVPAWATCCGEERHTLHNGSTHNITQTLTHKTTLQHGKAMQTTEPRTVASDTHCML